MIKDIGGTSSWKKKLFYIFGNPISIYEQKKSAAKSVKNEDPKLMRFVCSEESAKQPLQDLKAS